MKAIVCHMTSVHPANDIRIFHKQCVSLVEHGYEVHLVARGTLTPDPKGVIHHVIPVSMREGRLKRMIFRAWRTYCLAKGTNADLFHFHDPELLLYGLLLKYQGKTVIYDAHEDLPRDVMTKKWIPRLLRQSIAWMIEKMEHFIARRLDATITATPFIAQRFQSIGANAIDVKNYPRLSEFCYTRTRPLQNEYPAICYVGMISEARGMLEMLRVVEALNVRLIMAGPFMNHQTELLARSLPGWAKVDYRGVVSRQEIKRIFNESILGLCILRPTMSHIDALPIKLFEYMAAGLPVLASNFLLWTNIVERAQCGFCVDPLNHDEIKRKMVWMLDNISQIEIMGQKGKNSAKNDYSWEVEEQKLLFVYQQLLSRFN